MDPTAEDLAIRIDANAIRRYTATFEGTESNLDGSSARNRCRKRGAIPLVTIIANAALSAARISERNSCSRQNSIATGDVCQIGAEFVDVLPYLKDTRASDLWVTPPDPHPNALAHRLIAAGLFDALRKTPEAQ